MEMNSFFYFRDKFALTNFMAVISNIKVDNNFRYFWEIIRGNYSSIEFPVICNQSKTKGNKLVDVLGTGWPGLYLISERMKKTLEENHLTGWETYPVKIYDKNGNEVVGYHGFSIIGRCGNLDYSKSEIIEKQLVPDGPIVKYYKGVWLDLNQWDGSDFFMPPTTYERIITKKAAEVLKKNKFNVILENLEDYETNVSNLKQKTPG